MIIERQAANAFVYIEKDEKQMNDFVRLVTSIIAYRRHSWSIPLYSHQPIGLQKRALATSAKGGPNEKKNNRLLTNTRLFIYIRNI